MKEISSLKEQLSISKDEKLVAYHRGGVDYNASKKELEEKLGVMVKRLAWLERENVKVSL